jgi:hypothetical protein
VHFGERDGGTGLISPGNSSILGLSAYGLPRIGDIREAAVQGQKGLPKFNRRFCQHFLNRTQQIACKNTLKGEEQDARI